MTKKKVILLVVAALFAVSGLTALPSGNITGGVGCIVIAAVCAYFGLKKKSAGKENGNRTPAPAAASGSRVLDTIRTKVVGVTFNNEDGENRQDILSKMSGSEDITAEKGGSRREHRQTPERDRYTGRVRQLGNGQRFRQAGKVKKYAAGADRAENQKRDYI